MSSVGRGTLDARAELDPEATLPCVYAAPAPTKPIVEVLAGVLLGLVAIVAILSLVLLTAVVGCVPPRPLTPAQGAYAAELQLCVHQNTAWPGYRACAAAVEAKYSQAKAEERAR